MRTQIQIPFGRRDQTKDVFGRDITWITQEIIEDYTGSNLRSEAFGQLTINRIAQGNLIKIAQFKELMADIFDQIDRLATDLIEEFGEAHFLGRPKTKLFHIRRLELELENPKLTAKEKTDLYKELREWNGYTTKPAEKSIEVSVNTIKSGDVQLDRDNPREAERIVMSVFGSL